MADTLLKTQVNVYTSTEFAQIISDRLGESHADLTEVIADAGGIAAATTAITIPRRSSHIPTRIDKLMNVSAPKGPLSKSTLRGGLILSQSLFRLFPMGIACLLSLF